MKLLFFVLLILPAFADYTFLLRDKRYLERPFTIDLPATNTEGVKSFENYLPKGRVLRLENGDPDIGIINGPLIHTSRTFRHDWDFTIDGRGVTFADLTIELCDGQFLDIEQDPDYWFNTVGQFCPWGTRHLVDEIRKNGKILYLRR